MALKIMITEDQAGVFIVSAIGAIDSETYTQLEQKVSPLLLPSTKALILDMKEVSYISSMGVSVILKIHKAMDQNKARFVLTNLQPQVKKVFEIIKALPAEDIVSSIQELDEYLGNIQKQELKKSQGI